MCKPGDRLCGPFVVRCYSGGHTMFAGTLDRPPLPEGDEELWVCEFELIDVRRYKMPKELDGLRIDQVLTMRLDPGVLEPIEAEPVQGAVT